MTKPLFCLDTGENDEVPAIANLTQQESGLGHLGGNHRFATLPTFSSATPLLGNRESQRQGFLPGKLLHLLPRPWRKRRGPGLRALNSTSKWFKPFGKEPLRCQPSLAFLQRFPSATPLLGNSELQGQGFLHGKLHKLHRRFRDSRSLPTSTQDQYVVVLRSATSQDPFLLLYNARPSPTFASPASIDEEVDDRGTIIAQG